MIPAAAGDATTPPLTGFISSAQGCSCRKLRSYSSSSKHTCTSLITAMPVQELKDELDGGTFEDDTRAQIDDDVQSGINAMLLESGDDESFQEELERELGRPYKNAREAAADMLQVGSMLLGALTVCAHESRVCRVAIPISRSNRLSCKQRDSL